MYGVLALSLFIGSIFLWRYVAKKFFAKGKGRLFTYFVSTAISFFALTISLAIIAPLNPNPPQKKTQTVEAKVDDAAKKEQDFKEDQKALMDYLNEITPIQVYTNLHLVEVYTFLKQNSLIDASTSAQKCVNAMDVFKRELLFGKYKAIKLHDKEQTKALDSAIESLSLGYMYRKEQCKAIHQFVDDQKPSSASEAQQKNKSAIDEIESALNTIKNNIAKHYSIESQDGIWKVTK
jgi:hypothetical protein